MCTTRRCLGSGSLLNAQFQLVQCIVILNTSKISHSIATLIPIALQFNGKHNCEYACDISTENLVKTKTKKC